MEYLHTLKLKNELEKKDIDQGKNEDIFAELIQVLDDRILVMRDAKDNGQKSDTNFKRTLHVPRKT